jgi:hypothetical protein
MGCALDCEFKMVIDTVGSLFVYLLRQITLHIAPGHIVCRIDHRCKARWVVCRTAHFFP